MSIHKIINKDWLVNNYLVGIDLTDDDNNPYPDIHYEQSIDAAIAMREAEYDIVLNRPRVFTYQEAADSNWWDSNTWFLTLSEHRPLAEILSFSIRFGGFPESNIPLSWVHITSREAGQLQIVPGPEAYKAPFISGGWPWMGLAGLHGRGYIPQWIRIKYRAGYESALAGTLSGVATSRILTFTPADPDAEEALFALHNGAYLCLDEGTANEEVVQVSTVINETTLQLRADLVNAHTNVTAVWLNYDAALLDIIGLSASLPLLDTAGDLIIGAGISNQSLGVDGLSQSIGTTSGVENSGYGARATQYRKRIEELNHALRRRYRRHMMMIV